MYSIRTSNGSAKRNATIAGYPPYFFSIKEAIKATIVQFYQSQ